jgi:hypothetical protein
MTSQILLLQLYTRYGCWVRDPHLFCRPWWVTKCSVKYCNKIRMFQHYCTSFLPYIYFAWFWYCNCTIGIRLLGETPTSLMLSLVSHQPQWEAPWYNYNVSVFLSCIMCIFCIWFKRHHGKIQSISCYVFIWSSHTVFYKDLLFPNSKY